MSVKNVINVVASVTARIKNWAKANAQSFQHALTRFATERFLARLEASDFADRFVLKGGNFQLMRKNLFSGRRISKRMELKPIVPVSLRRLSITSHQKYVHCCQKVKRHIHFSFTERP